MTRLILTGGEPMLREDLPELLRIGHSYFPEVLLLTNGLLLTRRPDFVGELSRMGTRVHVSLDHVSPSIDDRVRGGTKGALVGLNALAAAHVETQVTLVLTAKNYSDLPYVIGYCRQHDFDLEVNPVAVPPTHPLSLTTLGGAERDLLVAELRAAKQMLGRPEYYFRVIRYLQGSPIRPLTACRAVEAGVFIEADGNIQLCGQRREDVLGNIRTSAISEVVDRRNAVLQAHSAGPCVSLDCLTVA